MTPPQAEDGRGRTGNEPHDVADDRHGRGGTGTEDLMSEVDAVGDRQGDDGGEGESEQKTTAGE